MKGTEASPAASLNTKPRASTVDPLVRWVAWGAILISSEVPEIILGHSRLEGPSWLPLTQCFILMVIALCAARSPRLKGLVRFLVAIAALLLGWYVISPALSHLASLRTFSADPSWGRRLLFARTLPVVGALLMSLTLIGSRLRPRDLYLKFGNVSALAIPEPFLFLRKPVRWTTFGPLWLLVFGFALPFFLYISLRPNFSNSARILEFLPWILGVAVLNAANEEFQFRCVPLAHLRNMLPAGEAVLLTAVYFGLGHYFGQPSGPVGVLMATFAGWIWGKSMIETRGFAWAFAIHLVQDIVIFCFLLMGDQPRL